ncbi:MAG: isochorismatase family protein [Verrucomicrobiota bacterium]|nr:isochorismatase family protein [Verrucomicrobiota bacterium]
MNRVYNIEMRVVSASILAFSAVLCGIASENPTVLQLPVRSRVEVFRGSGEWAPVNVTRSFPVSSTAILICDMWDKHWCEGASHRVDALAQKMAPVIDLARSHHVQIIHAPSEVMDFYKTVPQRIGITQIAKAEPPPSLALTDPPLPIDDSRGGCDTGGAFYKAWTRENPALRITGDDVVSDNGAEVYSFLRRKGIHNLLVMGVHTNMCILKRSFAIRQMTNWGIHCVLVRDLTDTMYDPKERPFVSHDQGTELVVEHIEKYWGPSMLSADLVKALQ